MSNVVCLEEHRARLMKPLRLLILGIDEDNQIVLTVTHESGATHTIRMSPGKAECFAAALQALADAARAEGSGEQ